MSLTRAIIAAGFLFIAVGAQAEISADEFTDLYVERLNAAADDITASIESPLQLALENPDEQQLSVSLHNAYGQYLQDNELLEDLIGQHVASSIEAFERYSRELSPADIVPVIKDSEWAREVQRSAQEMRSEPMNEMYSQPLATGLTIFYAEDSPTSIRYIDEATITEAGVDLATIREVAAANLLEKLPQIELFGSDGLYMISAGGNFEASLLLIDGIWSKERFDIDGDIVVSIPARDSLLITGTGNTAELEQVRTLSDEIYRESPYRLTTVLYVRRGDEWQVFEQ